MPRPYKKPLKLVNISKAPKDKGFKKKCALFEDASGRQIKTCFGDRRYQDFTTHGDKDRRRRYQNRHKSDLVVDEKVPKFMYPTRAGFLSMFILWNKKDLKSSEEDFKKRMKSGDWSIMPTTPIKGGLVPPRRRNKKKSSIPSNYIPYHLSTKDKKKQKSQINRSREAYKHGLYIGRSKLESFKSRRTKHKDRVSKIYNIKTSNITLPVLRDKTKCSLKGLKKIIKKGMGAFYSSGSRPNQTAHSWGRARLYSAISGGPASKVDYNILAKHCKKDSKALALSIRPSVSNKKNRRRRTKKK